MHGTVRNMVSATSVNGSYYAENEHTPYHKQSNKTAIGYVRVSTHEQSERGVSASTHNAINSKHTTKFNGIKLIDIKIG